MGYFTYESDRTIKIEKQIEEEINKVENLRQAMDLLVKIQTDFLAMYDNLATTTDHWERIAKRSTELSKEVERLRERNKILFMDYQTLLAKYKTVLEILENKDKEDEQTNNSNDNN